LVEPEDSKFQTPGERLSHQEMLDQADQILKGLIFNETGGTPHISRYDIREFVY
jgi:hypothetical protein